MARMDKKTHRFYSQNEHGSKEIGPIRQEKKMLAEIHKALQEIKHGENTLTGVQSLELQNRLKNVEKVWTHMRDKAIMDAETIRLKENEIKYLRNQLDKKEKQMLEMQRSLEKSTKPKTSKKTSKKKTTKKKLTSKKK